jgi:uncharacterized protein (TIGR00369 family)
MTETSDAMARLQVELERCPYHEFLRPEAVRADAIAGVVVVRLPYRPEFGLAYDTEYFHGGVLAALVDITGHAAVAVATSGVSPTIDLRVDFLRPAPAPELVAQGSVVRTGRSVARADVEVRDRSGTVVTQGRGAFSTIGGGGGHP